MCSDILSPEEAYQRFLLVREHLPNLSVVGIAGPGDALADWEHTRLTLEKIRRVAGDMAFCLSTNGLLLPQYINEIIALGIDHVTVTVNCLDPAIGEKIYRYVNYQGKLYHSREAAALLLENQLQGIEMLTRRGVILKINTVMIPGINDRHIPEISRAMKELGAYVSNIIPMIPVKGSAFENFPQTSMSQLLFMREKCRADLPQMRHCRQCRADAVGLLGKDMQIEQINCKSLAGEKAEQAV